MELAICGSGPAADAIVAATEDIDATAKQIAPVAVEDESTAHLAAAAGPVPTRAS